ncbi:MAG: hypothetical protein ACJ74W_17175, partial [Pyrinomonadaceae bacterium]
RPGDFIIAARGRRYFSNDALLSALRQTTTPAFRITVGTTPAADVYVLDERTLAAVNGQEH